MINIFEATPEHKIKIDHLNGETRNADLVCLGKCKIGEIAINIEAKADEEFGQTIDERISKETNKNSRIQERIAGLREALFTNPNDAQINKLRYQLLHGTASSLIYAKEKNYEVAVFIVYEFKSSICEEGKLKRNYDDLNNFLRVISDNTYALSASMNFLGQLKFRAINPFHLISHCT